MGSDHNFSDAFVDDPIYESSIYALFFQGLRNLSQSDLEKVLATKRKTKDAAREYNKVSCNYSKLSKLMVPSFDILYILFLFGSHINNPGRSLMYACAREYEIGIFEVINSLSSFTLSTITILAVN